MNMLNNKLFPFLCVLLFLCCPICQAQNSGEPNHRNFWLGNEDIVTYLEAVTIIKNNSLFLPPDIKREQIVSATIKSFLREADPFADYLTAEEYSKFVESQKKNYVGIGMEIQKESDGEIICIPYPGSPAEKAGIGLGHRLIYIDKVPVKGKSILAIASIAKGEEGTKVVLTVADDRGIVRELSVERSRIKYESVLMSRISGIAVIRIISFSRDTQRELKYILNGLNASEPIAMDLRGNPGGDLHSAIDAAMFFLKKDKKIVTVKGKDKVTVYKSFIEPINIESPIYLWQDERTASAAEVFIAALTQNYRAVSIGKRSYGKGAKQDIINLNDDSALILTTGYLETPFGTIYHGKGLKPDHFVPESIPDTQDYMMKVIKLESKK